MNKSAIYSLSEIMREQEAAASATKNRIEFSPNIDLIPSILATPQSAILPDEELARQLATEHDSNVALVLQNSERAELIHSHPRNFDAVESSYVHLTQEPDDDEQYYSDEYNDFDTRQREPKYSAPKNLRTGENHTEFKTYSTRNTGVKNFKKQKKFLAKSYQSAVTVFQVKQEDSNYGRISGGNLNRVYCFWDGLTRKAHILKKIKMLRGIRDGSLVLVKLRQYQVNVVDVIHVYSPQEEAMLFDMGEIVTTDPIEYLPLEVIRVVLEHMESQYAMDMLRQVSQSWNVVAKEHSPAKYLPFKLQYERRIKEIEWDDLSKWHWKLYTGALAFKTVSSVHCKFFWNGGIYHYRRNCDLQTLVLRIAEQVWNKFAPADKRAPKANDASDGESGLFTFTKCRYLLYKDAQLRNFASLVLWSWTKVHERDLDKIDVSEAYRMHLIQAARKCVVKLLSELKSSLSSESARAEQIQFLEDRWRLLLEQPKLEMTEIDFELSSSESSDGDSLGEFADVGDDDGYLSEDN